MNQKSLLPVTVAALAIMTAAATTARAQFVEPGDAGQTIATAANTNATANQTPRTISGTIGTATDADLYRFTVSSANPILSATAVGGTSSAGAFPIDTALFLFDLNGRAIFANDDQNGTSYQGALTGITLAPGVYFLGISLSGNEAVNANNQLLFAAGSDNFAVRGPAAGLNPDTLSTFNGGTTFAETGSYSITVSAVPEPSTWVLTGAGAVVLGVAVSRRRVVAA